MRARNSSEPLGNGTVDETFTALSSPEASQTVRKVSGSSSLVERTSERGSALSSFFSTSSSFFSR